MCTCDDIDPIISGEIKKGEKLDFSILNFQLFYSDHKKLNWQKHTSI